MASFILGQRSDHHLLDVNQSCLYLKRALRVASHTASSVGTDGILFMGKAPKKVGSLMGAFNPYEQILKNSACSAGASFFTADSST